MTAERTPTQFVRRWTCCECTNRNSAYCKPFCGCGMLTEQYCEQAPVPQPGLDVTLHPVVAARLLGEPHPMFHEAPPETMFLDDVESD